MHWCQRTRTNLYWINVKLLFYQWILPRLMFCRWLFLRKGDVGFYPDLEKLTLERIELLKPNRWVVNGLRVTIDRNNVSIWCWLFCLVKFYDKTSPHLIDHVYLMKNVLNLIIFSNKLKRTTIQIKNLPEMNLIRFLFEQKHRQWSEIVRIIFHWFFKWTFYFR